MTAAPLDEALDRAAFGGKAAQLAVALRAGFPVPAGVALSAPLVAALARGERSAAITLDRALQPLRPPLVARSSALGEDSEQASFAGQHLTRLNLRSTSQVAEAVAAIRESARTPAALAYRRRLHLPRPPGIAVLVQELVNADCAGVLFSRNPRDGADELVIEASWGLGEAVVAGLVVPDRVRVGRDGSVLEHRVGRKDVLVQPAPEGGTRENQAPAELACEPCLTSLHLRKLVALARRCDRVFPGAHDLEWAFERSHLYLLQRRAITRMTTLASEAAGPQRSSGPRLIDSKGGKR
jgi:pyruvate, water dikinase